MPTVERAATRREDAPDYRAFETDITGTVIAQRRAGWIFAHNAHPGFSTSLYEELLMVPQFG
jgi:hypothetical protein